MRKIAIIGGSGVYNPEALQGFEKKIIDTPYGQALVNVGMLNGNQVAFITRHGVGHSVPPHKINYRANMWALKSLGTEEIMATTAVGSLNPEMTAGHFVVCSDLLDFTKGRINTFFDGERLPVGHADFTHPYCEKVREKIINCLKEMDIPFHTHGCYVCAEGPRFETAAEVRMFASFGGDVVGMTNCPESILAREAEMHYSTVSIVTNMGAGISKTPLSHQEVIDAMALSIKKMEALISAFIAYAKEAEAECTCANCMKEFGGFKLEGMTK